MRRWTGVVPDRRRALAGPLVTGGARLRRPEAGGRADRGAHRRADGEARSVDASGLPELELAGLRDQAARELLRARLGSTVPADVEATLLRAARGNPLALLELPAGQTARQLEAEEPILGPPPLRTTVEVSFRARITRLPERSRRAILLAAADEEGDLDALQRAIEYSGLALADLEFAEHAGLVRLERAVEFRHPLVRSVVYRTASRQQRRAAIKRWLRLSTIPLVSSGTARWSPSRRTKGSPPSSRQVRWTLLPRWCPQPLRAVGGTRDTRGAADTRADPRGSERQELMRGFIDGVAALVAGDSARAGQRFGGTVELAERMDGDLLAGAMASQICMCTGDFEHARKLTARTVAHHRASGSFVQLSGTLPRAFTESAAGHYRAGQEAAQEGLELARHLGYENDETLLVAMHAWIAAQLGHEDDCRRHARTAIRRWLASGVGLATWLAHLALGTLELGLGDSRQALEHFDRLDLVPIPPTALMATHESIDAVLACAESERAAAALTRLSAWAPVGRAPLVAGLLARCGAIMARDSKRAERLFCEALRHHAELGTPYELAHTAGLR
jgi:hypothetical protein